MKKNLKLIKIELSRCLLQYRRKEFLTQKELGEKIGISSFVISRAECCGTVSVHSANLIDAFFKRRPTPVHWGDFLKERRLKLKLSIKQLAVRMNVNVKTIRDYENHVHPIAYRKIAQFERFLRIDILRDKKRVVKKWGDRCYNLRIQNKLSVTDVITQLNIHRKTLHRVENSQSVTCDTIKKILQFYAVTAHWLVYGTDYVDYRRKYTCI